MAVEKYSFKDVYDFIFEFYLDDHYLDEGPWQLVDQYTGKSIWEKLKNTLERPFKFIKQSFTYSKKGFDNQHLANKIWLFYHSNNNHVSLSFIDKEMEDTVFVGPGLPVGKIESIQMPFHRSFLYAYKFPVYWWHLYKKNKQHALRYFDLVFRCIGLYEVAYNSIKKYQPKCIVLANDHSEKERAVRIAAKKCGVPVVYIQHASISQYHPRLDFDLALLEGQASLDIYEKKGKAKGKTAFVGMPKFDSFSSLKNTAENVRNVGICTNLLDRIEDIENTIQQLTQQFPDINFSYRPHPSDKRKVSTSIPFSKDESIFDFLQRQDLLIAGNTSTHLEAVLMNVVSVHYEITPVEEKFKDYYGYIQYGLAVLAENSEQLFNIIKKQSLQKDEVSLKAQYYNAITGTKFEGKSKKLAIEKIQQLIKQND
ncbi:MAG: hypothetical protein ACI94Y_002341 [Maribacter sp.]|jgi:hypothetical protein